MSKEKVVLEREALIEMHQAGFVDCWRLYNKLKGAKDYQLLNDSWRVAFEKRFWSKIEKELKHGRKTT